MLREGLITPDQNEKLRKDARETVRKSLKAASDLPKASIEKMFEDVYEVLP